MKIKFLDKKTNKVKFEYTGKSEEELYQALFNDREQNLTQTVDCLIENAICNNKINEPYLLKSANVATILGIDNGNILDFIDDDLADNIIEKSIHRLVTEEPKIFTRLLELFTDVDRYDNELYTQVEK